jgi:hypothetical protein
VLARHLARQRRVLAAFGGTAARALLQQDTAYVADGPAYLIGVMGRVS